jgi:hypothetical protein
MSPTDTNFLNAPYRGWIRHGFQLPVKLSQAQIRDRRTFNAGTYPRPHFQMRSGKFCDPTTGEQTFYVPQRLLADSGVDFNSRAEFTVPAPTKSPPGP